MWKLQELVGQVYNVYNLPHKLSRIPRRQAI